MRNQRVIPKTPCIARRTERRRSRSAGARSEAWGWAARGCRGQRSRPTGGQT